MIKFIHAADIHLDSPLQKLERYEGAPVETLRRAARRAFENLIRLALSEAVDFLLIAGDVYDGDWKDYNTGLFFVSQLSHLREAGIPVFIIAGNHDAASTITRTLRLPDNTHLFPADQPSTVTLETLKVAIHAQSFGKPAEKNDLAAGYPTAVSGFFNIGMLHTCATGREGHERYAPCSVSGLASKGYDYWALGHVHQYETLSQDPLIVFPGNIQGRHIRETGPKGCLLVTVDDSGLASTEFRSLDVIRWARCETDVSKAANGYDAVDAVAGQMEEIMDENEGLPLAVRIELTGLSQAHGELSGDPERWMNEIRAAALDLSGGRIWVEKIKLRTGLPPTLSHDHRCDGPLDEILCFIRDVRSDPQRLVDLGQTLDDLWKKLPRELKHASDAIAPDNIERLAALMEEVESMLLRRLMVKGGDGA